MQRTRDRAANRAAGAGHQRSLAGQVEHYAFLPGLEGGNIVRAADSAGGGAVGEPLDQAAEHLAGTDLIEIRDASACHIQRPTRASEQYR